MADKPSEPVVCQKCGNQNERPTPNSEGTGSFCQHCGALLFGSPVPPVHGDNVRGSRSHRVWGCAIGTCMFVFVTVLLLFPVLFPGISHHPHPNVPCMNNLKEIGRALHRYHDTYGTFPPAYVADEHGKPILSWRVLLLPFLDLRPLYEQYDLSEPWNGPNNSRLAEKLPSVYGCNCFYEVDRDQMDDGRRRYLTNYVAIMGPGTVWEDGRATKIKDIIDGTSNTIIVAEVRNQCVVWTHPLDVPADLVFAALSSTSEEKTLNHNGAHHVLLADGSVRFITSNCQQELFKALATRAGGETIEGF